MAAIAGLYVIIVGKKDKKVREEPLDREDRLDY